MDFQKALKDKAERNKIKNSWFCLVPEVMLFKANPGGHRYIIED